ncbi:MAG: beta-galactosidase, partial [Luteibacter sp.]
MFASKGRVTRIAVALAGLSLHTVIATGAPASAYAAGSHAAAAHTIAYDKHSLTIDGKPTYIWSGSFHYWRLPSPSSWADVLQKMKAAGFNAVEIYFDWGYHSPRRGVYDFSGIRDVDRLLDMARDAGIYVIARPGPYINAETDAGGFPGWLVSTSGKPRSTSPEYTAAYREWMSEIDRILARHQVTNGRGTVLLYQVENEFYDDSADGRRYMQDLEDKARADGITVPLVGNHNSNFIEGLGAVDIPGFDSYPLDFDCTRPERWNALYDFTSERREVKHAPLFFPEFQGGAFDVWGGPGYEACRTFTGPAFERVFYEATIAAGSTMQNFYMT